ncbi:hypothetical protein PFJ02_06370 [Mycobacterium xenopi]|uniref:hypothetical protein n=1 Tax=Mycobacterium xenopi TaxID=1789 RepID=UPI0022EAE619|nr:hypothetical protein [Mycobacterium xenopi]MDA3661698.1 hypothetical protein [Mycobacterium xenopi]
MIGHVAAGSIIGAGLMVPSTAETFTCARVLVVGDLLRRVLEDIHSAQVLAALITRNDSVAELLSRSGLMVRPVVGTFSTEADAAAGIGKPLNVVITATGTHDAPMRRSTVGVAPVHSSVPLSQAAPDAVRFALANSKHQQQLDITPSLLARSQAVLARWRDRIAQWSQWSSRPVPASWRTAVVSALDDLDVARVIELMDELENADHIEPGAKFEAFSYADRVLGVDLMRDLGRVRRCSTTGTKGCMRTRS